MPFNQPHMLMQWSGHFARDGGTVVDEFAGTMRFVGPGIDQADNDETARALLAALKTFWQDPDAMIPSFARLQYVKWNRIGTDGRYVDKNNTRIVNAVPDVPGYHTTGYPLQVAWATTWLTDFARGTASKGRTFWPTSAPVTPGADMRVTESQCGAMAQAGLRLITNLSAAAKSGGSGLVPAILSDVREGNSAVITGVRVGNRLDIQRRRDNSRDETYVAVRF